MEYNENWREGRVGSRYSVGCKKKKKQKKLQLGAVGERLTFIYNGTWQTITVGNRNGVGYNGN